MVLLKIDTRESELIRCCQYVHQISPIFKGIEIKFDSLPIGDVIISLDGTDKVIIERKTLRDLAASIKDGRYEEQSYRLNGLDTPNHNIAYLVEGDFNKFNVFKDRMDKLSLYSAMVSLNFYKGFSVLRSVNVEESALMLLNMAYKIAKCEAEGKTMFYSVQPADAPVDAPPYCSVVKKVKKENITPDNIGEIMLYQIPGVSAAIATTLMQRFGDLASLMSHLQEDPDCLKDVSQTNAKNQTRRINKTAINNIVTYLKGGGGPPAKSEL